MMVSEAYQQGLKSDSYDENPYQAKTQEFEDFNAGHTQRIRRGFRCKAVEKKVTKPKTFQQRFRNSSWPK
jgi:hypothetical protein